MTSYKLRGTSFFPRRANLLDYARISYTFFNQEEIEISMETILKQGKVACFFARTDIDFEFILLACEESFNLKIFYFTFH